MLGMVEGFLDNWDPTRILFMKYSFRIIHGATTKSKTKVDLVLKNKNKGLETSKFQKINHHSMLVVIG